MTADPCSAALAELPDAVRARVLALTADVLPDVPQAARRRYARSPTSRRPAGPGSAAPRSPRRSSPTTTSATGSASRSPPGRPPTHRPGGPTAALAWLIRPEGWEDAVDEADAAGGAPASPPTTAPTARSSGCAQRLADAEQAVRELQAAHRAQLDELKAENTSLRRKLGETRTAERDARAAAEQAAAEQAAGRGGGRGAVAARWRRRTGGCGPRSSGSRPRPRRAAATRAPTATRRPCGRGCCSRP